MHKKFSFYFIFDLRHCGLGAIISAVHGSVGFAIRLNGETPPGFLGGSGNGAGSGRRGGFGRPDGRSALKAGPFSGGISRENGLNGPLAFGVGGSSIPSQRWFFLVGMSPQGHAGRAGAFERGFRVPGGSSRGRPLNDSSLPGGKATFRRGHSGRRLSGRGQPRGSRGNPRFQWEREGPPRQDHRTLRRSPLPLRGRRPSPRVSPLSLGMR